MKHLLTLLTVVFLLAAVTSAHALQTYDPGPLKPVDSVLKVAVGDMAPDFELPTVEDTVVTLSEFRGKKNVVISFVPAAFTPICSDQWPGYRLAKELFDAHEAEIIGITVDNIPSQKAWVDAMEGLNFPVGSDFWPHGAVAEEYGVLRSDGVTDRAIFIVDKQGVIRFIHVEDINTRPDLGMIIRELEKLD